MLWSNYSKEQTEETETESYEIRIGHLQEAHRVLDLQLHEMEKHPHVDEQKVAELKKKKLQYKDEIIRLTKLDQEEKNK
jgi:hypothetical protein